MNMREQLRAVAKEYARLFGDVIGVKPSYWVGADYSLGPCAFGDYFFGLEEMQVVVDNLDRWVKKHGTIEKVAAEVIDWHDYAIIIEHQQNLFSWLDGHRPTANEIELERICGQINVLREIVEFYPSHTVGNVIMQLEARAKELSKTKERKDKTK